MTTPDGEERVFCAMLGTKGDWPYLRKERNLFSFGGAAIFLECARQALALSVGYNCRRKCHLCSGKETQYATLNYKLVLPSQNASQAVDQEWFDMSINAVWRKDRIEDCPSPFKCLNNPLSAVPSLTLPNTILIDSAHTWHIGFSGCTHSCV